MMNSQTYNRLYLLLALFLGFMMPAYAAVRLPQLVSNHMVLQRDIKLKLWGWANPGEKVSLNFNGKSVQTRTTADGKWLVQLPAMKAGGPYVLKIKGVNEITLSDVMIGDVWFCSGQSNMVLPMERLKYKYAQEVANDHFPEIRNFFVSTKADVSREYEDMPAGKWTPATGKGILEFGGVTYFFAKKLYQQCHVPIGIINSSVGGTPIEAWISADGYQGFPAYQAQIKNFRDTAYMSDLNRSVQTYAASHPLPFVTQIDKGLSGPVKWTDPAYVPKNWHPFFLPGYWADQGVKGLNGILYFRKEVEVPKELTGIAAKLIMGTITNSDSAFVNGQYVGNTTYQYPPRIYTIPPGLLKPGKNIIVMKVVSSQGKGGFVPDKTYAIDAAGRKLDLRGDWTYQVAQVQAPFSFTGNPTAVAVPRPVIAQSSPTGLYNAMTAPAINYGIKGFLWYQGETNAGRAAEYAKLLPALIKDWREKWGQGDLPFIFPQLPNFMEVDYSPGESGWAELRQSQLSTLAVPNTGMAVAIDAGEWNDIHPLNKKDVGERLALWAEHLAYQNKELVYSGPLYKSASLSGSKVALNFSSIGTGLSTKDSAELYYFAIAGADKKFVWATARIEGNQVIVWNDHIDHPKYVRYAWADNPEGANLCNLEGLPASPFEAAVQ